MYIKLELDKNFSFCFINLFIFFYCYLFLLLFFFWCMFFFYSLTHSLIHSLATELFWVELNLIWVCVFYVNVVFFLFFLYCIHCEEINKIVFYVCCCCNVIIFFFFLFLFLFLFKLNYIRAILKLVGEERWKNREMCQLFFVDVA